MISGHRWPILAFIACLFLPACREAKPQYTLTVTAGEHGTVSPTGGTYEEGTVVTLTATPDSGFRVSAWTGTDNNASTATTNTVTMNTNKTVSVSFAPVLSVYAGKDMTVDNGGKVFLVGLPSGASGNITYAWTQKSGPTVTIQNAQGQIAEFTAPQVASDTEIKVQLAVTDAINQSATAEIKIKVWPHTTHPPTFTVDDAAIEDIYGDDNVWPGSLTPLGPPCAFVIDDINGDGFKDVIYTGLTYYQNLTSLPNPTPKTPIKVLINNGNRTMSDRTNVMLEENPGLEHAKTGFSADFNGDGRRDVIFCGQGQEYYVPNGIQGERPVLLIGQPNGTLKDMSSTFDQGRGGLYHWMAVGDVNRDQKPDIVFVDVDPSHHGGSDQVLLLMNKGDGTFERRQDLLPTTIQRYPYGGFFCVSLIDVNDDTAPDLLLGDFSSDSLLLINDGNGNFKSRNPINLPQVQGFSLVLYISPFDFNGDNFKDLIVTRSNNYTGRYMQALINDRHDGFIDASAKYFPDQDVSSKWADKGYVCDIDGDGDQDYVIEIIPTDYPSYTQRQSIFINNGAGVFKAYPQPLLPKVRWCMMPCDIDNDNIIELLSIEGQRDFSTNPWRSYHRWVLLNNTTPRHY